MAIVKSKFIIQGVSIKYINGNLEFTGVNVPISFLAKSIKKSNQYVRLMLEKPDGLFSELKAVVNKKKYRNRYYISDKKLFEVFGIKYIEN